IPDLPVRPVRRILPPHGTAAHAAPGRRISGRRHVRRPSLLPLPVPIRWRAGIALAPGKARRDDHARQGTRLRALYRRVPVRRDREDARRAPELPLLRPLLSLVSPPEEMRPMRARIAAALIAVCVAVLLADYVMASWRAPRDDRLVKSFQQQVK